MNGTPTFVRLISCLIRKDDVDNLANEILNVDLKVPPPAPISGGLESKYVVHYVRILVN